MPQTSTFGTESAANKAIGGIPTIHYFDYRSRGRGQVVRLLLIDAGAAFKDTRYTFEEWPEHKRSGSGKVAEINPTGNMPVVEMPDGTVLTQSYAIIRHWSRMFGSYDGKTEKEKYWADAICDIVVDCRQTPFNLMPKKCLQKIYRANTFYFRILFQESKGRLFKTSARQSKEIPQCNRNTFEGLGAVQRRSFYNWQRYHVCGYGFISNTS